MKNSSDVNNQLVKSLSSARVEPYLRASSGDIVCALELYRWNASVSAAMFKVLSVVEVGLRNALDTSISCELSGGKDWLVDYMSVDIGLNAHTKSKIAETSRQVSLRSGTATHSRLMSELNFGFWTYLLAKNYESVLWTPALRHAFPGLSPARRCRVYEITLNLRILRNRIAHHEPILERDLLSDLRGAQGLVGWISPELRTWIEEDREVHILLGQRPSASVHGAN